MKKVLVVSLMLSLFTLAFSILMSLSNPIAGDSNQPSASPAATDMPVTETPSPSVNPSAGPSPNAEYALQDGKVSVRVYANGQVTTMTMHDYLIGVVAAEMPASFGAEALKAQAVAARTETLYHILLFKSTTHPDADVCTDPGDCQAYKSDGELREKWGDTYGDYIKKVTAAVESTDGQCLTYHSEPIQAVFHSSSAGQTADSGEVWANKLPYLVSVKSPETAASVPNFVSSVTVTQADFKETVLKAYPNAVFPKDKNKWVTDITYTESGRIKSLKLGGVSVTGPVLRTMFGLRSTAASIELDKNNVIFTTTGYGHGVGMSQYGANAFASEGKSYKDILAWYYTGVTFQNESDLINK